MNPTLRTILTAFFLIAVAAATGCSSTPKSATAAPSNTLTADRAAAESSVEITYILGHSHRRFLAEARDDQALAQSFMDHQVLRESAVDLKHYREFLDKAGQAVEKNAEPIRGPAQGGSETGDSCRYPFKIVVRASGGTRSTSGCRGEDDGVLGRLLRDGEFLLSARK